MLSSKNKKYSICKECKKSKTPAINAAKLGHTECLVTAYRELGVFNERDEYGATPIHFAARNGKLECLKWLVERSGVSPNAATLNGNTAAHDAAATGCVECLEFLLLQTRCNLTDTNAEGATVLHVACRFGQTKVVQWLVEIAECPLNSKGDNGVTAVHLSAAKNHVGCLKWLTGHSDYIPNERTVHGATPVYFAAQEGSLECLQWLIEHGKGHAYQTALDGMAPIHAAAQAGKKVCLEYMVKGASVSIRSRADDGATPAHFAAASGQVECLEWILDNGGSVMDRDNLGGTPVHDAAEQGQVKALTYFVDHGIDVNSKDNDGLKPVDLAKENNHQEAYELLFRTTRPKIMSSMEPNHSLSRASGITEEQKEIQLAENKQKVEAMKHLGSAVEEKDTRKIHQLPSDSSMTAQSTKDSVAATPPASVEVAASDLRHSDPMSRQHRRSSVGIPKRLDSPRESSPDVDDINAAILMTMETHEIHTEIGREIVVRKKTPTSPGKKPPPLQTQQKKSLFGFFSSPPKGSKSPPSKTAQRTSSPMKEKGASPQVLESPIEEEDFSKARDTDKATRPQKLQLKKKKVRKVQVVRKKSKGSKLDRRAQSPLSSPTKVETQSPLSSPTKMEAQSSLPSPKKVEVQSPLSSPTKMEAQSPLSSPTSNKLSSPPPKIPSSPPPKIPSSPPPKVSSSSPPKMSSSSPPKMSSSPSESSPLPRPPSSAVATSSTTTPASPPPLQQPLPDSPQMTSGNKDHNPKKEVKSKDSRRIVQVRRPDNTRSSAPPDSNQIPSALPKRSSTTPQKRLTRKPIVRKRHATSTSVISRNSSSTPGKRPPSSSKKPRPSSVDSGGGGRRLSIDKLLPVRRESSAKEKEKNSNILQSVSNIGFDENEESQVVTKDSKEDGEVVLEDFGKAMAVDVVKNVLSDITEGPTNSTALEPAIPVAIAKDIVQQVIKEATPELAVKEEHSTQQAVGRIPTPPPPPPLPPPPLLVPYVFRPQLSPRRGKPPEEMEDSPPKPQVMEPESSDGVTVTDGSFMITFVAGTPELRSKLSDNLHSQSAGSNETEERSKEKALTHKEKLEMEEETLRKRRVSVRSSWEEKWVYRGPLESALYPKIHEFKKQRVERGYTDVLKKADDFLASSSATSITDSDTDKEEGATRSGSLGNRLKMFGGAASFLKPSLTKETKPDKKSNKEKQQQDSDETGNKDETDGNPVESQSPHQQEESELLLPDGKSMPPGSSRRRSSSCVSITVFATIEEENQNNHINESIESLDKVLPLPKIGQNLSRRQSMELLRLDGMVKSDGDPTMYREKDIGGSRKGSTSSLGESALVHSISTAAGERKNSGVASIDPKTAFMNSANLPHINRARDECEYQEMEKVKESVNGLISKPQWADSLRVKFKGLNIDDTPKVQIWQFNQFTVPLLPSIRDVEFGANEIYMFFEVKEKGPLLYHLYIWLGISISRQILVNIYEYVQNLALSLPGKPVIHREFYGYESLSFHQMLGKEGVAQLLSHHKSSASYLNRSLSQATLFSYSNNSFAKVELENCTHKFVASAEKPLLLNSPTGLYVWLPNFYWEEHLKGKQDLVLFISESFVSTHSLPKWTPVVVMTQGAEIFAFCDHFPDWEPSNLNGAQESDKLRLPCWTPPKITYPSTGQLKVWTLVDSELQATSLSDLGHFFSQQTHVVHYTYPTHRATNPSQREVGVVYIWLGSRVQVSRDQILKDVGEKLPAVISAANLPTVIVPEGLEPQEFLYLFKGKFIIQKTKNPQGSHLFKLSAKNAMSVKTEEVPASSSSLHSCHTYCLVTDGKPTYVWAGQFADKRLRRASLVIAKTLSKSKKILVMAEGLEIKDFWQTLGGPGSYKQYSSDAEKNYFPVKFYSVNTALRKVAFTELNLALKPDDLDSNTSYLLAHRNQIFIRIGKDCDKGPVMPTQIVKSYVSQYCSFRTSNDFVATLVHEGSKGDLFLKWFGSKEGVDAQPSEPEDDFIEELEQKDEETLKEITTVLTAPFNVTKETKLQEKEEPANDTSVLPAIEEAMAQEIEKMEPKVEDNKSKVLEEIANESEKMFHNMTSNMGLPQMTVQTNTPKSDASTRGPEDSASPKEEQIKSVESAPAVTSSLEVNESQEAKESSEKNVVKSVSKPSGKKKRVASATPMVDFSIFLPESDQTVKVRVKESANVLTLLFKAAEAGNVKVRDYYAIFETYEALAIQRALEDHEVIKDVVAYWPRKKELQPTLALKIFPTKNHLWTKATPIPKEAITAWTKQGVVPDIGMKLYCHQKVPSKQKWVQEKYSMQKSGMVCENKGAGGLPISLDHTLYVPFKDHSKMGQPTPFCFIMKLPSQWRLEEQKMFCMSDASALNKWIHTIRLMKHGLQLKGNYLAMKKKIDAITAKELLKESTALGQ